MDLLFHGNIKVATDFHWSGVPLDYMYSIAIAIILACNYYRYCLHM